MSYRKSIRILFNVDICKLWIKCIIFWYRISKMIDQKALLVNIHSYFFSIMTEVMKGANSKWIKF